MPNITFEEVEIINSSTMTVSFPADVDGRRIRCFISNEALHDHFGADHSDQLTAFRNNRYSIESKARELIKKGQYEADGSILLRTSDF